MKSIKNYLKLAIVLTIGAFATTVFASTYTVTTTNDTGPNSLRAIITTANGVVGPHTISFGTTGHFAGGGTINLLSPLPVISNSVTISGWLNASSNNAVTVNGSALVFQPGSANTIQNLNVGNSITSAQSLSISGCVINNGGIQSTGVLQIQYSSITASPTVGIWSSGNATLNGVTVSGCSGSGIHNEGTMAIADSQIYSNTCSTDGGGIWSSNSIQVTGCRISNNTTSNGRGGGIFNSGIATIYKTTISSNTCNSGQGGGVYDAGQSLVFKSCLVAYNVSKGQDGTGGGGGGAGWGGGVYLGGTNVVATNTTFSANTVVGGNGAAGYGGKGGGLLGGSGGVGGQNASCGQTGTAGSNAQNGGYGSGGGGGGAGGAAYPGEAAHQTSSCYKFCNWSGNYVTYGCGSHNVTFGGGYFSGYNPCPNTLPSVNLHNCPYYTESPACSPSAGGSSGTGGNGGCGGGGGFPSGSGGCYSGSATATSGGGGASFGSGIFVKSGSLKLVSCTVALNEADGGSPGGHGLGAVANESGQIFLVNTIIGANSSGSSDGPDVYGIFSSLGYNFIGNTSGSTGWNAVWDYQNATPLSLGPLQDNGGPTLTCALLPDSLCILSGTSVGAPSTDQRGVIRPANNIDIGAYQFTTLLQTVVTWTNPAPIIYGTALSSTQLNANANYGGTFAYTPPSGTILNAGSNQVLTAVFTPSDPTSYTGGTNTVLLTVLLAPQTITFPTIPPQPINAAPILLNATTSSGLPVSYTLISGDALLAGNLLSVGSTPGQVVVRAAQAGNTNYLAATNVDRSFLVVASAPAITTQPTNMTVILGGSALFNVAATTAPLTYQWQFASLNIGGQTNQSLALSFVTTNQAGPYRVIVSNPYGSVTSSVVVLTVNAYPGSPTIISQPASVTIRSGETASFSVGAVGDAPLTYGWYNGMAGFTSSYVGANSSSYSAGVLTNNTSYWVSVSNSLGKIGRAHV